MNRSSTVHSLGRHSVAFRLWASVIAVIVALFAVIGYSSLRSNQVQERTTAIAAAMDAKVDAARRWAGMTTANVVRVQASAASTQPSRSAYAASSRIQGSAQAGTMRARTSIS